MEVPLGWLLDSQEPAARWIALTGILDRPTQDPAVRSAHSDVVGDARVRDLVAGLSDWTAPAGYSGHQSPAFAPNTLNLLADMGVGAGDFELIEDLLDVMLAHQDPNGRFQSFGEAPGTPGPVWGALLCDSHPIIEVLVRFGRGNDPRVKAATDRMITDLADTPQGHAWPCAPHTVTGWRGPGRKADVCPMVTLQALRVLARLPAERRPVDLLEPARVVLRAWRFRATEQPHMFGHGRAFKTTKWPPTWYGAYAVLDTLGRLPTLWRSPASREEDVAALTELSATAMVHAALHRLVDLSPRAARIDVTTLTSSKGGTGTAVPPA